MTTAEALSKFIPVLPLVHLIVSYEREDCFAVEPLLSFLRRLDTADQTLLRLNHNIGRDLQSKRRMAIHLSRIYCHVFAIEMPRRAFRKPPQLCDGKHRKLYVSRPPGNNGKLYLMTSTVPMYKSREVPLLGFKKLEREEGTRLLSMGRDIWEHLHRLKAIP